MGLFIVLLGLSLVTISLQVKTFPELIRLWAKATVPTVCGCLGKTGADPVIVDNWLHYGEYPDDAALKCSVKCVFLALNVMDSSGVINEKVFKQLIPLSNPDAVAKIYAKCGSLTGTDLCDTPYLIHKCAYDAAEAALT